MDDPITTTALRAMRRILRATEHGGRQLAHATGLTPSQLLVLQEIERRPDCTPSIIASGLKFGLATVSNIIDRLEEAGLAKRRRSEIDRRQVLLEVTKDGRDALHSAPDLLHDQFRDRFEALPPWERAMILAALERLGQILGAENLDGVPLIDHGSIDRAVVQDGDA